MSEHHTTLPPEGMRIRQAAFDDAAVLCEEIVMAERESLHPAAVNGLIVAAERLRERAFGTRFLSRRFMEWLEARQKTAPAPRTSRSGDDEGR